MLFFPLPALFFRRTGDVYGSTDRSSRLEEQLVDVTPDPVFTRLEGLNDRVVGGVKMLSGVRILRIVTATDMPTGETEAQVHPRISNFQTVLTAIGARGDVLDLIKMRTALCHVLFLPDACIRLGAALILLSYHCPKGTLFHSTAGIEVPLS
jgi:hypothetical protein